MKFSLIVCTLGERKTELERLILSLNNQTYNNFEVIFLSQKNHSIVEHILNTANFSYKHIKLEKTGLSYSRNEGFKYVSGNYITISDDDCWYIADSLEKISKEIKNRENLYTVFSFKIFDPINQISFKNNYLLKEKQLNILDILHCSSIEIFFHHSIINDIRFDERFGVGSIYPSGEENIFLTDIIKKGYKIIYIPIDIVYHRARTIAQKSFDYLYMKSKFYLFRRMYGTIIGFCLYYIFYLKKYNLLTEKIKSILPYCN